MTWARTVESNIPLSVKHKRRAEAELTFATTGSDSNLVPTLEYPSILDNRIVHLGLEHLEEAILADLAACLWPFDNGFGGTAEGTQSRRHGLYRFLGCVEGSSGGSGLKLRSDMERLTADRAFTS
jgi:hypothetical protein